MPATKGRGPGANPAAVRRQRSRAWLAPIPPPLGHTDAGSGIMTRRSKNGIHTYEILDPETRPELPCHT